ncbi:MAG: alpha/beta fold hydrolase [Atopobiaceae bacterium]|nr:alpha/beta fold hydrolase [Atopobiaceae bacterium]
MDQTQPRYRRHIMWCKHDGKKVFGVANLPLGAEQSYFTHETFPTVVLAHGLGADHTHMDAYSNLLADHGFVTYAIDFCGGGETSKSDGSTLDMTVETERDDLLAAVKLMLDEPFVNKSSLFLMGSSQGGYVSARLAQEMPDTFKALALVYPAFVLYDNARETYPEGSDIPDESEVLGVRLSRAYAQAAMAHDPYEGMPGFSKPVLIVHGSEDSIVPIAYSKRAAKVLPQAHLEVIEGANHGFRGEALDRSAHLVLDFLTKQLGSSC